MGMGGTIAASFVLFQKYANNANLVVVFQPMVIMVISMVVDGHRIQVNPMKLILWPALLLMGSIAKEVGGRDKPGPVGLGPD